MQNLGLPGELLEIIMADGLAWHPVGCWPATYEPASCHVRSTKPPSFCMDRPQALNG